MGVTVEIEVGEIHLAPCCFERCSLGWSRCPPADVGFKPVGEFDPFKDEWFVVYARY
jgi:hypothetical protein